MNKSDRLFYESPELRIVELKNECAILNTSGDFQNRDNYNMDSTNPFGNS